MEVENEITSILSSAVLITVGLILVWLLLPIFEESQDRI